MEKKGQKFNKGEIVIYQAKKGPRLDVHLEKGNVWLRQEEIAKLYGKERSVISKHISKIFADKEVEQKSNVHFLHIAKSDKPVIFYSLDIILAVGYRANSVRAIFFRRWATDVLKKYLLEGYLINEKRLMQAEKQFIQLKEAISFLQDKSKYELLAGQEKEIINLLADYSKTLTLLKDYDQEKLTLVKKTKGKFVLNYKNVLPVVSELKKQLLKSKQASDLFGKENGDKLKAIFGNIYQTFGGKDLYFSLEEKAAHLLYFVIKDHPFVDGNKRIGSFLFIYFLDKNKYLHKKSGEKKINDNALTALSLLIAISDPKEKNKMVKIITHLLEV